MGQRANGLLRRSTIDMGYQCGRPNENDRLSCHLVRMGSVPSCPGATRLSGLALDTFAPILHESCRRQPFQNFVKLL
jgi:hypothetical protein